MSGERIVLEKNTTTETNYVVKTTWGLSKYKNLPAFKEKKPLYNFNPIDKHSIEGDVVTNFCYRSDIVGAQGITGQLFINTSPTCNCQIYSISNLQVLFNSFLTKEEKLAVLEETQRITGKNQVLIDCEREISPKIKELLGNDIVFEQDYKNTKYNSEMTIFLIRVDSFRSPESDDYDEEYYDEDDD